MRRRFLIIIGIVQSLGFVWAGTVIAQTAKVLRVGILCPVTCDTSDLMTFREALARSGYTEPSKVVFVYRWAGGDLKRLPDLAGDLERAGVDVIYTTFGTSAGLAAKHATESIPVVVGSAGDLVASGMVKSLGRPGGNITGITSLALELEGKRLEFLKQLLPTVSRIAFFRDTTNPYSILALKEQQIAAARLGVELSEIQFHEPSDVDAAFGTIASDGLTALCVDSYIPVLASRDRIVQLAADHRVAAIYPFRHFVAAGGLLSYGSSLDDNAKRAAEYVGKILDGAKPADLPVERSTKVELVINMRTANSLGLTVPPSILARADEVIE
jgi:putative ABC transport system substrate-binding protein